MNHSEKSQGFRQWRFLFSSIAGVLFGGVFSVLLVTVWNPEFHFWTSCFDKKRSEVALLQEGESPVVIFCGGSTCAFSIDPEVLRETIDYPIYNFGGAVPMGSDYLLPSTIAAARKGDTIVLALEPVFLTTKESVEPKSLGVSMMVRDIRKGVLEADSLKLGSLRHMRPGGSFFVTFFGKMFMGLPGYRYSMDDFRPGGRLSTEERDQLIAPAVRTPRTKISPEGHQLLNWIVNEANSKGIHLLYTLPWNLTAPEVASEHRKANQDLLAAISEYVPVIEDRHFGVFTDPSLSADEINHLSDQGARLRTLAIQESLEKHLARIYEKNQ